MKDVKSMYRPQIILARNISIEVPRRRSSLKLPQSIATLHARGFFWNYLTNVVHAVLGQSVQRRTVAPVVPASWQPKRLPYNSGSLPNPEAKAPGCFQLLQMRGEKKIRIAFYLLAAGGAALFTLLLIRQGAPHVLAAFASAGWWIAAVAIYHLAVPVFLDAIAWWALFPKSERL